MQRSLPGHGTTSSSSSSAHSALSAVRRTFRPSPSSSPNRADVDIADEDQELDQELELADLADPRPWETRAPLKHYGSQHSVHSADHGHLPLYKDSHGNAHGHGDSAGIGMETRQRRAQAQAQYGEKEGDVTVSETDVLDDQGKWQKGHLAGPGVGGRRGLPPKQRIPGWVSKDLKRLPTWSCLCWAEGQR
jgi:hypothetical protein